MAATSCALSWRYSVMFRRYSWAACACRKARKRGHQTGWAQRWRRTCWLPGVTKQAPRQHSTTCRNPLVLDQSRAKRLAARHVLALVTTTALSPLPYTTAPGGTGRRYAAASPPRSPSASRHTNLQGGPQEGSTAGEASTMTMNMCSRLNNGLRRGFPHPRFEAWRWRHKPRVSLHLSVWPVREDETSTSSHTQRPCSGPTMSAASGPSSGAQKETSSTAPSCSRRSRGRAGWKSKAAAARKLAPPVASVGGWLTKPSGARPKR